MVVTEHETIKKSRQDNRILEQMKKEKSWNERIEDDKEEDKNQKWSWFSTQNGRIWLSIEK